MVAEEKPGSQVSGYLRISCDSDEMKYLRLMCFELIHFGPFDIQMIVSLARPLISQCLHQALRQVTIRYS